LPACEARTVQVPAMTMVSVVPLTWHVAVVVDANVTGRPELAVAASANGGSPKRCAAMEASVIDCFAFAIANDWLTTGATLKLTSPGCAARTVQVPAASSVTLLPATLQVVAVIDAKDTGSFEVAVAATANGAAPNVRATNAAKAMVWLALAIFNVRSTGGAAL